MSAADRPLSLTNVGIAGFTKLGSRSLATYGAAKN